MTTTSTSALSVTAAISLPGDASTSIGVGEPFWLSIEASHAPGRIALLPQSIDFGSALGERTAARVHQRTRRGAEEIDHYRLELIAFEPGELALPAIPVAVGTSTASTPPLSVTVTSGFTGDEALVASSTLPQAIPELEAMAAQDPLPESITGPDYTLVWALGIAALAALLIAVAVKLVRLRRMREAEPPPPPPPRPAHEVALERLLALEAAGHPKEEALKEFFSELSEILRAYAGGRWAFDSLELTVDELMDALEARRTDGLDRARLRDLLVRADLVKFAKYRATRDEAVEAFQAARALVEGTRPTEGAA